MITTVHPAPYKGVWKIRAAVEGTRQKIFYGLLSRVYERSPLSLPKRLVDDIIRDLKGCCRVLDVGCATGYLTRRLAAVCDQVVGVDINRKMVEISRSRNRLPNTKFIRADAHNLPFPDACFDGIVLSEILQHLDVARALKEVDRVAVCGCRAIIVLPDPTSRVARVATRLIHVFTGNNVWVPPDTVVGIMRDMGWKLVRFRSVGKRVLITMGKRGVRNADRS
ncbi:class I SAM-dependent methyltransferase [Methanopyrus sp.]